MIVNFPPATWDGHQNINPEKLNRNIAAARAALAAWGERRWVRNTVTHRVGSVTVAAPARFHIPVVSDLPYIIDRITILGDVTGDTGYVQWGMASTFSTDTGQSFPLNSGSMSGVSLSRGTVLPGYSVAAGTDWGDTFVVEVGTGGASTTMANITIEVALRYDRAPGLDSDPYSSDVTLYRSGDALTAERFNGITSAYELYAASWITLARRRPDTMHYVQLRGVNDVSDGYAMTVALPGSGPETIRRILARAQTTLGGPGAAGQDVFVRASYGTWGITAPVQRLSFPIAGLTVATASTGAINISDALRDPANPADDLLISGATDAATFVNVGIWVVRDKT